MNPISGRSGTFDSSLIGSRSPFPRNVAHVMLRRLAARWNSDEITNRSCWVDAVVGAAGSRVPPSPGNSHRPITRQSQSHNARVLSLNKPETGLKIHFVRVHTDWSRQRFVEVYGEPRLQHPPAPMGTYRRRRGRRRRRNASLSRSAATGADTHRSRRRFHRHHQRRGCGHRCGLRPDLAGTAAT